MMNENSSNKESIIKRFSNVPAPSENVISWVKESTPIRELEEVVEVKMAPSYFFRDFVREYLHTINNFFVGPFAGSRPQLDAKAFVCKKTVESEPSMEAILEAVQAGVPVDKIREMAVTEEVEELLTEEELLLRYFETEFWAVIAFNKRQFCKKPNLKNLLNHIGKNEVHTPILIVNALNCIGPVQIAEKAIRLEPTFVEEYDYESRLLTREQFIAVSDWFNMLQEHGFKCVDFLKLGANGHRDFMMMTLENSNKPSKDELNGKSDAKTPFTVRSTKLAHNIIGLYRHFFYTEDVRYLSSDRRIFQYGTDESNLFTMKHIVKTMLVIPEGEQFNANTSKVAMDNSKADKMNPNQDKDYQAEQSSDDKVEHSSK